jgi:ADP-ribosylglycohydrolase
VEFRDRETIRERYPDGVRDLRDGGTWGNLAGQPTDDSEMALMLARTLAAAGRYDPGEVLDSYCHWWPHAWDRGSTLSQALSATRGAETTTERLELVARHASQVSQSNGCLMRISPLGIFAAGHPDRAAAWARQDCRLTHPHPVCQDACAVYVQTIATVIREKGDREAAYAVATAAAADLTVHASVRDVLEQARHQPPEDYSDQMGWVLIALQNAFYQVLHAPNLEEGVVDTVMRGGDTDTNAAIAGALLGAVHGRAAIPPRWLHAVLSCRPLRETVTRHPQPMEFWPVDALELAEALLYQGMKNGRTEESEYGISDSASS